MRDGCGTSSFLVPKRETLFPSTRDRSLMDSRPGIRVDTRPYFIDNVSWNEDGQVGVCLENSVHVLVLYFLFFQLLDQQ